MALTLDDINTESGCLQYLFLAETLTPASASYSYSEAVRSFNAIKATIYNRLASPADFPPRPNNAIDVMTQPGQFPELSKDSDGNVVISAPSNANIQAALAIANDPSDGRQTDYVNHIQAAIDISRIPSPIIDEFKNITSINGVSVRGGTYGFNRGASIGRRFIFIPNDITDSQGAVHNGTIMGNKFMTLVQYSGFFERIFRRLFRIRRNS